MKDHFGNFIPPNKIEGREKISWRRIRNAKNACSFVLLLLDKIIKHTEDFILVPEQIIITQKTQTIGIIEKPTI